MATYYVRPDGNNLNAGTGYASNQAWQTLGKALGATGIGAGDTLYVAPGSYRLTATISVANIFTSTTLVVADPSASQFPDLTAGRVLVTNRSSSDLGNAAGTFIIFTLSSSNNLQFYNFIFEQAANANIFNMTDSVNIQWHKCMFQAHGTSNIVAIGDTTTNGLTKNYLFRQCISAGFGTGVFFNDSNLSKTAATSNYTYNLTLDRCVFYSNPTIQIQRNSPSGFSGTGFYFYNCQGIVFNGGSIGLTDVQIKNCIGAPGGLWTFTGTNVNCVIDSCSCYLTSGLTGFTNTNLHTAKYTPINVGLQRLWNVPQYQWFSTNDLYSYATGTASGTPIQDFYGNSWDGGSPNYGAYNNYAGGLLTHPGMTGGIRG